MYHLVLLYVSPGFTLCITWFYFMFHLVLLYVSPGFTLCITWFYFMYHLVLLYVSPGFTLCITWFYFMYHLVLTTLKNCFYLLHIQRLCPCYKVIRRRRKRRRRRYCLSLLYTVNGCYNPVQCMHWARTTEFLNTVQLILSLQVVEFPL